ncbi:MAG: aldehyde dehydrogenase family protein, partial [Vicinamibacteria bacterium]
MTQHDLFIGGSWMKGASYQPNRNPSNLDDSVGDFAHADEALAKEAIAAARAALPQWSRSGIQMRADALDRVGSEILTRREELGRILAMEEGKTLKEGIGEVARAGNIFKFFAGEALRSSGELVPSVRPGV